MKRVLFFIVSLVSAASLASAANNNKYTSTADPNSSPDGVDQSASPVNVWTVTTTPGFNGSDGSGSGYFDPGSGLGTTWQLYSYQNSGVGNGGGVVAATTFAGGALTIGQKVSIDFVMRATDPGKGVGVSLQNGSGDVITFGIFGGEPNGSYPYTGSGYYYSDTGSSYVSAGSMGYQYQSPFNIAFTVTGAGTYSAVAGSDSWSGTFSGSLIGMSIFNKGAGNASDVGFNNLIIVPEPGTLSLVVSGLVLLGYGFRRRAQRS